MTNSTASKSTSNRRRMRHTYTRRTVLGASAAIGASSLVHGFPAPAIAQASKLTVWGGLVFSDLANEFYMQGVRDWGAANNVEIDVIMINKNEMLQKVSAAMASGSMPDILDMTVDQLLVLAIQDVFLPVDDIYERVGQAHGGWFKGVHDSFDTKGSLGHLVALPFGTGGNMLLRRMDLAEAEGFTEPPATWVELVDQAEAVSEFPVKGLGFALSSVGDGNAMLDVMHSYGGRIAEDDGRTIAIKSEETRSFLDWVVDAWNRDVFPPGAATWDGAGDNQAYLSGQTAFVSNTGSIGRAAKQDDPELFEVTGYSAFPAGPIGTINRTNPQARVIPRTTGNEVAARELLEYLGQPAFLNEHYRHATYGPVLQDQSEAEVFTDGKDPILRGLLELSQMGTAPAYPDVYTSGYAGVYNNYLIPRMIQRKVIDGWSTDEAMDEAHQQAELIYAKFD